MKWLPAKTLYKAVYLGGNEESDLNKAEKLKGSERSNVNLSHQQLKEDASLRPRIKQTPKKSKSDN